MDILLKSKNLFLFGPSQKMKDTFRLFLWSFHHLKSQDLLLKSENLLLFEPPLKMNSTVPLSLSRLHLVQSGDPLLHRPQQKMKTLSIIFSTTSSCTKWRSSFAPGFAKDEKPVSSFFITTSSCERGQSSLVQTIAQHENQLYCREGISSEQ